MSLNGPHGGKKMRKKPLTPRLPPPASAVTVASFRQKFTQSETIFFFFPPCCSFRNWQVRMHKPELKTLSLHCSPPDEFILARHSRQKIESFNRERLFFSKKKFKPWKRADRMKIHSTSMTTQPHQTPSTLVCKSTLRPN